MDKAPEIQHEMTEWLRRKRAHAARNSGILKKVHGWLEMPILDAREAGNVAAIYLRGAAPTEKTLVSRLSRMVGQRDRTGLFESARVRVRRHRRQADARLVKIWEGVSASSDRDTAVHHFRRETREAAHVPILDVGKAGPSQEMTDVIRHLDKSEAIAEHMKAIKAVRKRKREIQRIIKGPDYQVGDREQPLADMDPGADELRRRRQERQMYDPPKFHIPPKSKRWNARGEDRAM